MNARRFGKGRGGERVMDEGREGVKENPGRQAEAAGGCGGRERSS